MRRRFDLFTQFLPMWGYISTFNMFAHIVERYGTSFGQKLAILEQSEQTTTVLVIYSRIKVAYVVRRVRMPSWDMIRSTDPGS